VLRYLSRYTHRVAISNRRLVAADNTSIAFRCKRRNSLPASVAITHGEAGATVHWKRAAPRMPMPG
jgi:hypothetical protein